MPGALAKAGTRPSVYPLAASLLFLLMFRLYGRAVLTPAEHDFGGKGAILIGKRTCAAVFLCNMGDGLDTDPVFPPLG